MDTTNQQPQVINTSVLGMLSAVVTSLSAAVITTAVKSNTLIDKTFNMAIHGASAGEHLTEAGEFRAKIYSKGIKDNGVLAERENTVRARMRLSALEKSEALANEAAAPKPKPRGRKPAAKK